VIGKQDILERAAEWELRPEVVEKDYVLGWLLAGIASHPETALQWVFNGIRHAGRSGFGSVGDSPTPHNLSVRVSRGYRDG